MAEELVDSNQCVVLGVDDTIQEKPYSRENELICWHYDHTTGRTVKGINLLSAILTTDELATPIGAECIRKPIQQQEPDGRIKRKSQVTKNELFRQLLAQCWQNTRFDYVAADSWFSGAENMDFIKNTLNREFVMAAKCNRLAALSEADKQAGQLGKDRGAGRPGSTLACLAAWDEVSRSAAQTSLHKRRWIRRGSIPGGQRPDLVGGRHNRDLPKTVEDRRVP